MDPAASTRRAFQPPSLVTYLTVESLMDDLYNKLNGSDEISREETYESMAHKVINHFKLLADLTSKKEIVCIPEQTQEIIILLVMCLRENINLPVLSISNFEAHSAFAMLLSCTKNINIIKIIARYGKIVYVEDPTPHLKKGLEVYNKKQSSQP